MKIDELDFTVRTYNTLKRGGIDTVEELAKLSDDELMKIRNFGSRCLMEVHEKLGRASSSAPPTGCVCVSITNGDHIRAMSDEELADWIARTQIVNVSEALKTASISFDPEDGLKDDVEKACLEWLRQPAEMSKEG